MILAGDVGGTKTRLAIYETGAGGLERKSLRRYESRSFHKFRDIVRKFQEDVPSSISAVCIGVPGPVIGGRVKVTNLPWELVESELAEDLGVTRVKLVNDLAATTAAIPCFRPEDLVVVHEGKPGVKTGVSAVVAPGTGLGQGFLHVVDGVPQILASEGGHADFAPTNDTEIELLRYLLRKYQRASYERVLSGPGLINVYNSLKESDAAEESPEVARSIAEEHDPAAVISRFGLDDSDTLCSKALDVFASVLGAQAGNMVLTVMATDGIYLGGGIPPRIVPKITSGILAASYLSKGRLSKLVAATPLYLIRDDHAALLGAASIASRL